MEQRQRRVAPIRMGRDLGDVTAVLRSVPVNGVQLQFCLAVIPPRKVPLTLDSSRLLRTARTACRSQATPVVRTGSSRRPRRGACAPEPVRYGTGFGAAGERLEAELGYGFGLLGDGALTPFAAFGWMDSETRVYRVGCRFQLGQTFQLSLEGDRRERVGLPPGCALMLRGSVR